MPGKIELEQLSRLLDRHGPALALFAAQWSDSPEDCVQEAFVELMRQPLVPTDIPAWLFRVVRNRAISTLRAAQRRRRHESLAARLVSACSESVDQPPFDAEELAAALQSLDDSHREVIVAKIWGGLGFEQIAALVGTSTSSAHRRYESGLEELRKRLGVQCEKKKTIAPKT